MTLLSRSPLVLLLGSLIAASPLQAQTAADDAAVVHFTKGSDHVRLEGAIRGDEYFDYRLDARAGQTMTVNLKVDGTNGDGTIYFNLLPPGSSGEAIYNASMDGNIAHVKLPRSGPYVVRLYLMGNDRDADKTVGYDLEVTIR